MPKALYEDPGKFGCFSGGGQKILFGIFTAPHGSLENVFGKSYLFVLYLYLFPRLLKPASRIAEVLLIPNTGDYYIIFINVQTNKPKVSKFSDREAGNFGLGNQLNNQFFLSRKAKKKDFRDPALCASFVMLNLPY